MTTLHRSSAAGMLASVLVLLAACGDGQREASPRGGAEAAAVDIENPGTITGTVTFTGTPPAPEPVDMRSEQVCAQKHDEPTVRRVVWVNDNGTLRNVFVYVKEGLDMRFPTPTEAKELDQRGCEYHPHVIGLQTGQTLEIHNSDAVLHNVNTRPSVNRGFNLSQPREGMTSQRTFSSPEVMIPVRCDVHGWMFAYIGVVDHPYYAVTGEDGSFRIENLPPGNYVVEAWHEEYGTQTMNVTVPPDGNAEASFSYSAGATALNVPLGEPIEPHGGHIAHAGARR